MDEPLSNLDAKLRLEMRSVISSLQNALGITTVYVTHDQEEALAISSRIAVMNAGDIYQVDQPERIYSRPYNTFVANFIGSSSMIPGVVKAIDGKKTVIAAETGIDIVMDNMVPVEVGHEVLVGVRPEEFTIVGEGQGMKGVVRLKQFLGKTIKYEIDFANGLVCEVSADTNSATRIYEAGEEIWMSANTKRINVFDKEKETTLIEGVESHV